MNTYVCVAIIVVLALALIAHHLMRRESFTAERQACSEYSARCGSSGSSGSSTDDCPKLQYACEQEVTGFPVLQSA